MSLEYLIWAVMNKEKLEIWERQQIADLLKRKRMADLFNRWQKEESND